MEAEDIFSLLCSYDKLRIRRATDTEEELYGITFVLSYEGKAVGSDIVSPDFVRQNIRRIENTK